MKKKIFFIVLFFSLAVVIVTTICVFLDYNSATDEVKNNQIVLVNEIDNLIKNGSYDEARLKLNDIDNFLRNVSNNYNPTNLILVASISIIFIILVFLYVYIAILRPFDKLKEFASEISNGNFDIPLNYERSNYFGKFTWAFDNMRNEIIKARKCEAEAIENNKTVIASLSHDIKTPIASISAYAEALEANIDSDYNKRAQYLNVIMAKAQEVKKLTDDLFLHSVSELDKISFNFEKLNLAEIVKNSVNDFKANVVINYKSDIDKAYIYVDQMRTYQIFENILNNSVKYANTNIDIEMNDFDSYYLVTIRDYGEGILDSDMPFIFEKFYRGKNTGKENGTGLGLYIVKYMIEKMDGKVELESNLGLLVKLFFKKCVS